ncbi:hypothetical protein GAGA_4382 [Paraglaciecola agarilytica NO2]|uniref:Uncharacterized protein n=1 Tax=Paraglaciecola agarilytica NO2 TaxID=1125747 RepID=A0ABQ0ICU6_9ALTE|nr:hypothetical protein GAGA_4382 [Paraglaciecola agarilytica NO2]
MAVHLTYIAALILIAYIAAIDVNFYATASATIRDSANTKLATGHKMTT